MVRVIGIITGLILFSSGNLSALNKPERLKNSIDSLFEDLPADAHNATSLISGLKQSTADLLQKDQLNIYKRLGDYYLDSEMYDSATMYYNKGIVIARSIGDNYYNAAFHQSIARVLTTFGEYREALDTISYVLNLFYHKDSAKFNSDNFRIIGNAYWGMGIYEKALENYYSSLEAAKKKNLTWNIAAAYNNIGLIYRAVNDTINELKFLKLARNMSIGTEYKWIYAKTTNNIGNSYFSKNIYDSALHYFKVSGEVARELGGILHEGVTLFNAGKVYLKMDSIVLAEEYLDRSLKLARSSKDIIGISNCLLSLGECYLRQGLLKESISMIDSGLEVAKTLNSFPLQKYAYELKAEYYQKTGNTSLEIDNLKNFMSIKDSLNERESAEKIAHIEFKYWEKQNETEIASLKRQKNLTIILVIHISIALILIILVILRYLRKSRARNKLLVNRNDEIEKQRILLHKTNEELKASQKELRELVYGKDRFITIISHDLKNPVSAIRGYIELLIREYDNISEDKKKLFLKQVFESVEKTSLLINNILYWVRSQTRGIINHPEPLKLYGGIKNNIGLYSIIAAEKEITILNEVPKDITITADKNIFDTIIRNLLSNSIKFTQPGGEIEFSASEMDGNIELVISDTGIGFTKEKLNTVFSGKDLNSSLGTNHEQGTGLGLSLVREFSQIIHADFSIDSTPDKGSRFILKFRHS